jgi:hypothetical protein
MCRPMKSAAAAAVSRPGRGSSGCVQAWQISRGPDAPGGGPWIGGPDDRGGAGRQSTRCQIFVGAPVAPRAGDLCPGRLLVAVADFAGACLHRPVVSGPGFGRLIPVPPAPVSRVDRRPGRNARRTELARPPGSRAANPARRRRSRPTQTTPRERAPRGRDGWVVVHNRNIVKIYGEAVMAGRSRRHERLWRGVPAIQESRLRRTTPVQVTASGRTWMAGPSPAMTWEGCLRGRPGTCRKPSPR